MLVPDMLQSVGSRRFGYNLATEQQQIINLHFSPRSQKPTDSNNQNPMHIY